jgi:hypothetical protein
MQLYKHVKLVTILVLLVMLLGINAKLVMLWRIGLEILFREGVIVVVSDIFN